MNLFLAYFVCLRFSPDLVNSELGVKGRTLARTACTHFSQQVTSTYVSLSNAEVYYVRASIRKS